MSSDPPTKKLRVTRSSRSSSPTQISETISSSSSHSHMDEGKDEDKGNNEEKRHKSQSSSSSSSSSSSPSPSSSLPLPIPIPSSSSSFPSSSADVSTHILIHFKSLDGVSTGPPLSLPLTSSVPQLTSLLNELLKNEEKVPYSFFINDEEILSTVHSITSQLENNKLENKIDIIYQPQAVFRVKSVTRCAATIPGHSDAVLSVAFSPDGSLLATGSGDHTVRIWDVLTATPKCTLRGHSSWVLSVEFSPNMRCIASGGMDSELRIWSVDSGSLVGKPLKGHSKYITSIQYEPYHLNPKCERVATGSKDGGIRIWDLNRRITELVLNGHTAAITNIKWGGKGFLYSASQDKTIKVWDVNPKDGKGKLIRSLEGHAHWINHIAMNTHHVIKSSYFDRHGNAPETEEEKLAAAKKKYEDFISSHPLKNEIIATGSDDFTIILWDPLNSKKPIIRITGHQQPVNYLSFSPDGLFIASASFDKSVKLWSGLNGKYVTTFRGHVQAVYQCSFSPDSRLIVSSSKDSTMKIWDIKKKKLAFDLPGHADEVFACDWSPNGEIVASGGKDQVVKIWRH